MPYGSAIQYNLEEIGYRPEVPIIETYDPKLKNRLQRSLDETKEEIVPILEKKLENYGINARVTKLWPYDIKTALLPKIGRGKAVAALAKHRYGKKLIGDPTLHGLSDRELKWVMAHELLHTIDLGKYGIRNEEEFIDTLLLDLFGNDLKWYDVADTMCEKSVNLRRLIGNGEISRRKRYRDYPMYGGRRIEEFEYKLPDWLNTSRYRKPVLSVADEPAIYSGHEFFGATDGKGNIIITPDLRKYAPTENQSVLAHEAIHNLPAHQILKHYGEELLTRQTVGVGIDVLSNFDIRRKN